MKITYTLENKDLELLNLGPISKASCYDCPYEKECLPRDKCRLEEEWKKRRLQEVYEDYQKVIAAKNEINRVKKAAREAKAEFRKKYNIDFDIKI